jgi:hypothetical protein
MKAIVGVLAFCTAALAATGAEAQSLEGTWSGSGYAQALSGTAERIRCRVSYARAGGGTYGFSAVCASPSYKVNQSGTVSPAGPNRFVGDFYNAEYDIGGRVRVVVSGSKQTVTLSSDRGSGQLNLSR